MPKDTKRTEDIINGLKSLRSLIREDRLEGVNLEHVEHDLAKHQMHFQMRLTELREHNARQSDSK